MGLALEKIAVSATFWYVRQQKGFQGNLGTQDLTSMSSWDILGPSVDPTGLQKWISKSFSFFQVYHKYTCNGQMDPV